MSFSAQYFTIKENCDSCGLCLTAAPANIRLDGSTMRAFIYKQPVNDEELRKCRELIRACPRNSVIIRAECLAPDDLEHGSGSAD